MRELNLAGREVGGGSLGEGAVEEFVVKELVGDLGEAIGRQDGNGKGEPVLGVIVVFRDRRGKALAEFYLGLEAGDTEVLGDMKVVEKHFLQGGLKFRGRVVAVAADLLEHFLSGGFGIVGLAEPVEDEEELFLHLSGGTELVEGGGVKKFLQILLRDFDALELAHALGRGHGVEDQAVVWRQVVPTTEQVDIGVIVVLDEEWDGNRRSSLNQGRTKKKPNKEKPVHAIRLNEAERTESP